MEAENHLNKVVNFNSLALPLCPDNQPKHQLIHPSFIELVKALREFKLKCAPFNEAEIEIGVEKFLHSRHFPVSRQVVLRKDRFDLIVDKVIIEAKLRGFMNVAAQLDRYSASGEGLILVCWRATKPLKTLFKIVKLHSKIPVELIEITKNCDVV
jgi:hypothetical protein